MEKDEGSIQGSFNIYVYRYLKKKELWEDFMKYLNNNPSLTTFTQEEMDEINNGNYRGSWKGNERKKI